jgi:hypothetical protein
MKLFRQIALSAFLTVGAFGAIFYTSCSKDKCKDVTCNNGGTCTDGNCVCTTGYEGTNCETASRDKFLKTWSASDVIGSSTIVYSPTIAAGSGSDVTQVLISNFSDFFTGVNTTATVSGNTITIPRQSPTSNAYFVQGSGTITSGTITWNYTIDSNSLATQNYTGTWH